MRILFTLLAIQTRNEMYLEAARTLTQEIIELTKHDVLITTNNVRFFDSIASSRVKVRNNIPEDQILSYTSEFNYNTKHLAFEGIPSEYDVIFYMDCDVKLAYWNEKSDAFVEKLISTHEYGATRLNAYLGTSIDEHNQKGKSLFTHKILSYGFTELSADDPIRQARLPSEHFLIFKNIPDKIDAFYRHWRDQDKLLQVKNASSGSWGDGFEIGIAVHLAKFINLADINHGDSVTILGIRFNGNKH